MKNFRLIFFYLLVFIAFNSNAQAPDWIWARGGGGNGNAYAYSVVVDPAGNVLVTGSFSSQTIVFGAFTLTNAGGDDMFIVKYDPSGNVIWAKQAGGSSDDQANSISVDGLGNIYIVGNFQSSNILFGTNTLVNGGIANDIFIVKYGSAGNVIWAKKAGGANNDIAQSISTESNGNFYVTGFFRSSPMNLDTSVITNSNPSSHDMFIAKYDLNGNVLWAKSSIGSNGNEYGNSVKVDKLGNAYVLGQFDGLATTFGSVSLQNISGTDVFLVKYDINGNVIWAKSNGSTNLDGSSSIAIDASNNVYITGSFSGPTISFGATTLTNTYNGAFDVFIAKFNDSGTVLWAKSAGGNYFDDFGNSVALDPSGNVYVVGTYSEPQIQFGTITLSGFGYDSFLVKYDSNGNVLLAKSANGGDRDYANSVAVDASGLVYVAGYFNSSNIIFNNLSLPKTVGGFTTQDMYLAKFGDNLLPLQPGPIVGSALICSPAPSSYSVTPVTGATSYTWTLPSGWFGSSTSNSITVTPNSTSGTISVKANNAYGSSAAQTLNVLVGAPPAPGPINGNTFFCGSGVNSYSVVPVNGATFYTWTLPNGWTGSSTTNVISVTTATTSNGYVTVKANNSCGSSQPTSLSVSAVSSAPGKPGSIGGKAIVSQGSTNVYSVVAVNGASSYTWTLPSGWNGSSTTNTIFATADTLGGVIKVTANNGCGSSAADTLVVKVSLLGIHAFSSEQKLSVYPNPFTNEVNISGLNPQIDNDIKVVDLLGKVLMEINVAAGHSNYKMDMNSCPTGIYFLKCGAKVLKLIKN